MLLKKNTLLVLLVGWILSAIGAVADNFDRDVALAAADDQHNSALRATHRQLEQSCSSICPYAPGAPLSGEGTFNDDNCNGFTRKVNSNWGDYAKGNNTSDCDFFCCTLSADMCCEDYPAGYWVAFILGVAGIGVIIIFVIYQCYCAGGKTAEETK